MVKRVPAVTSSGAFTGEVLSWLDERYGGTGAVTGAPVKIPGVTTAGAFKGDTLSWLDARYGGSGAVTGTTDRLPAVAADGAFSGKVLTWLDGRYSRATDTTKYTLPTFTHPAIDPRDYLTGNQTWTGVADIRTAFQLALNDAHALAFASSNNVIEFIIPPGIGKLTSSVAQGPINYYSSSSTARLANTIGFPLRPNMPGKIVFHGGGGRNETSTIQLSNQAKCLFYADTDGGTSSGTAAGYTWTKLPEYSALAGNKGKRPTSLMSFQNYDFVGFCVDNKDALGQDNILSTCHTVFGAAPTDHNNRQMYMSFYNLNHSDIRVKGFDPNPTEAEQVERQQVPFAYRTRHTSHHESTGGASPNLWGGWDLDTLAGRQAAFNARWTIMHRLNFYDVEVVDAGRAIHVTSDRTTANNVMSQWFDEINLYRCTHVQPNPYAWKAAHTSFFLGAGGMGGTARAIGCVSENVGDNPIEMGAFQNRIITNFTSKNARLPGILFTNTQIPPTPSTCIVDGYTFTVDAEAMLTAPRARGFEFDLEGDGVGTPISATIKNATMIIDGGSSKVAINKLIRSNRYGWVFDGPIKNLDIDGLNLVIQNVSTPSTDRGAGDANNVALQKTYPLIFYKPSGFDLTQATCTINNVDITVKNWVAGATSGSTTPCPIRIIGLLPLTSGTFSLDGLKLTVDNSAGIPIADAVAVGAHQTEWSRTNASGTATRSEFFYTPLPSSRYIDDTLTEPAFPALTTGENTNYNLPGGRYTIKNVSGATIGTTLPATRRALVVQKQNPYTSLSQSGIVGTGWGSGVVTLATDVVPNDAYSLSPNQDYYGADMYYWTQRNTTVTV